jgi:hypothetical protein
MGVKSGVNHAEFMKSGDKLYFLEIAARVPGSNLDQLTTAATGVDLFAESAKIQYSRVSGQPYRLRSFKYKEAGLVQCLARVESPCLGAIEALPELTWSWASDYHVGAAFSADDSAKIEQLAEKVLREFQCDHLAVLPASESPA